MAVIDGVLKNIYERGLQAERAAAVAEPFGEALDKQFETAAQPTRQPE